MPSARKQKKEPEKKQPPIEAATEPSPPSAEGMFMPEDPMEEWEVEQMVNRVRYGVKTGDDMMNRLGVNRIVLPIPPSANHAYVNSGKRRFPSPKLKQYWAIVEDIVCLKVKQPLTEIACLRYHFFWPDLRKRDTDNYIKSLKDGLNKTLVVDDNWKVIKREVIDSDLDRSNPRVVVMWEI